MKNLWQFLKFSLVGVSNTLISEGVYAIMVFCGGHYLPASLLGFVLSTLNAYYWNSRYVFKASDGEAVIWWKALAKTFVAYSGGYLIHVVLLVWWIDILHIARFLTGVSAWCLALGIPQLTADTLGELLAAALNLLITVPVNYIMNKYWAFKH